MARTSFKRCDERNPCPICGKRKYCSIAVDGRVCCTRGAVAMCPPGFTRGRPYPKHPDWCEFIPLDWKAPAEKDAGSSSSQDEAKRRRRIGTAKSWWNKATPATEASSV